MAKPPKLYLYGWTATVGLAFVPLLYSKSSAQYLEFLPAIMAIIIPMLIEQYSNLDHRARFQDDILNNYDILRADILKECQRAITGAQVVTVFSVLDAHKYVASNAVHAKRIFNTRLANSNFEHVSPQYMEARDLQDDGFIAAIANGSEYNLIYDVSQEHDVKRFLDRVPRSSRNKQVGIVHASRVDARGMPLMQFIILEYESYKECLLGYGMGDEIVTTHEIYLIRSLALCSYLRHVHENFIHMLSVKVVSG